MLPFRVVIRTPLPEGKRLSWIDLNPNITALSWETGVGGFVRGDVGYKILGQPDYVSGLKNGIEVPDLATAQIFIPSESGFCCFEGRVQEVDDLEGTNVSKFNASGLGTSEGVGGDEWFYVAPTQNGMKTFEDIKRTALNLLNRMVPSVTDIITVGGTDQVTDPGGSYTPREQAGRYLGQALDQIIKAGVQGGQEVMYAVYEDRRIQLRIIEPPLDDSGVFSPDWRVTPSKKLTVKRSGKKLVGAAAVQFTPPGGAQDTTEVNAIDGWSDNYGGLFRSFLIPPSQISYEQAVMVRDRYLRRFSVPVITGMMEIVGTDGGLRGRTGQPAPFYAIRYGQWLQIGEKPYFITKTKTDACYQDPKTNVVVGRTTVEFINVPLSQGEV